MQLCEDNLGHRLLVLVEQEPVSISIKQVSSSFLTAAYHSGSPVIKCLENKTSDESVHFGLKWVVNVERRWDASKKNIISENRTSVQSPHLVAPHNGSQVFDRLDVRSEGFGNSSSYGRAARRSSPDLCWRNGLTCAFGLFSTIEDTSKSSRLVLDEILQIAA